MRTAYGVPVVERAEDLPRVVQELGIVPWEQVGETMDLDVYRDQLLNQPILRARTSSREELEGREDDARRQAVRQSELERFAPKGEVLFLVPPGGTEVGTYFRSKGKNWVAVFATVPDPNFETSAQAEWGNLLVPIVAEWKHGAEVTVIGPVYGMPNKGESLENCARREFEEETGFKLATVEQLTLDGLAVSPRQTTQMYWPFRGTVQEPVERGEARLDETEDLKLILVRLDAWVEFILSGAARDDNAYVTTFLALHKMGLLQVSLRSGGGLQL